MRIRTVKPQFFKHEGLFDLEKKTGLPVRVAFPGLWCVADREGRFRWNPRELKSDVLPYDDVNFVLVLEMLQRHGFIVRYVVEGKAYGYIPSWSKHQVVNPNEAKSRIPAPPDPTQGQLFDAQRSSTGSTGSQVSTASEGCTAAAVQLVCNATKEVEVEGKKEKISSSPSVVEPVEAVERVKKPQLTSNAAFAFPEPLNVAQRKRQLREQMQQYLLRRQTATRA